jgi:hypothetical protein
MAKLRTAGSHTERLRDAVLDACRSDLDADDLMAELSPDTLLASWPTAEIRREKRLRRLACPR